MALSAKDKAAVKKAAVQGLGSGAAGQAAGARAVAAGDATSSKSASSAPTYYGIDKRTGTPVTSLNDTPSGERQAGDVSTTPDGVYEAGAPLPPEGSMTNPSQTGASAFQSATQQPNTQTPSASVSITSAAPGSQAATSNKYQQAFSSLTQGGAKPPADPGQARSAISGALPQAPDTTFVTGLYEQNPELQAMMKMANQYFSPEAQKSSLLDTYKKMRKESGIDQLDEEIIDAQTIIEGTEDDIRNEIQTAGGFGTDSQVMAMSVARNKGLLKRYNQLVAMKQSAQDNLNTMMNLTAEDRKYAAEQFSTQINLLGKVADFRERAINNTKEQSRWLIQTMGVDGVYNAYSKDPRQLGFLENILGIAPGGMKTMAAQAAIQRTREETKELLDIDLKREQIKTQQSQRLTDQAQRAKIKADMEAPKKLDTQVVEVGDKKYLVNTQTGETIKELGDGKPDGGGELKMAHAKSNIDTLNKLSTASGLAGAVGPNALARGEFGIGSFKVPWGASNFTGAKSNFIGDIESVVSNLTLDKLHQAKANGTTFGSLTEGERAEVATAATKIGSWRVKDGDKVVGYNANESDFKKEIDRINNFAKLDYVINGGNPKDVGIIETADGSLWAQNSDGSMTELR